MWYLQYINDDAGNTGRLVVATGADLKAQRWFYYDFTQSQLGAQFNEKWFDYPDLAVGSNYLYITTNVFGTKPTEQTMRGLILRVPLADLAAKNGFTYNYFSTTDVLSLRPTQGATDPMYFGSLETEASIKVYSWPESAAAPTGRSIAVRRFSDGQRISLDPNNVNWLAKINPGGQFQGRITGAWVGQNTIGFAWSAAQDSDFANPYVRGVVLNQGTLDQPKDLILWNRSFAYAYPSLVANGGGKSGLWWPMVAASFCRASPLGCSRIRSGDNPPRDGRSRASAGA
jgi:hypothetical protein